MTVPPSATEHLAIEPRSWMGSRETLQEAVWVMMGMPYDGTTSYRPGTRFAPAAIRQASYGLETYSPLQDRDFSHCTGFYDAGDLALPIGNRDQCLNTIQEAATSVLTSGKRWFGIGGEHLVTLPVVEAYLYHYPDLAILHFDAHADLREDFLGERLSHATVLRRIVDRVGSERLVQVGIRSGEQQEFQWMRAHGTLYEIGTSIDSFLERLKDRPVFLTVDLDVLDPSIFPGTGTPEPGGFSFKELIQGLLAFEGLNFVGADAVELSPDYDPSGVSTVVAAKVIREMLLMVASSTSDSA